MCSVELKYIPSNLSFFAIHTHTHTYMYICQCIWIPVYTYTYTYIIVYSDQSRTVYFRKKILNLIKLNWGKRKKICIRLKFKLVCSSLIHIQYYMTHSPKCNNILFAHHFHIVLQSKIYCLVKIWMIIEVYLLYWLICLRK